MISTVVVVEDDSTLNFYVATTSAMYFEYACDQRVKRGLLENCERGNAIFLLGHQRLFPRRLSNNSTIRFDSTILFSEFQLVLELVL